MKQPVVLDSFALVSFFHKEPGWDKVRKIFLELSSSGQKALLCKINWGDFYYIVRRRVGRQKAEESLALLGQLPIDILSVDDALVHEAAELKAEYPISYADAFCVAVAKRHKAQVVTNDPEFKSVEGIVPVLWLTVKRP
ncbi:MAG: type II toxin-antitoxin system VapC family toxin [Deltaproteobacteria bacterium]|nr:type II toxin-antitoxin system VapC family toxin [Deltaproteobacteria bacterium]